MGDRGDAERRWQVYYLAHERPQQLRVRELASDARATRRGAELPLVLQAVEAKVLPRPPRALFHPPELPPPPCATAASKEINRRRKETRQLRWVGTTPEKLCWVGAHPVVEMTRATEILKDFHDTRHRHQHRDAWRLIQA